MQVYSKVCMKTYLNGSMDSEYSIFCLAVDVRKKDRIILKLYICYKYWAYIVLRNI